MRSSEKSCRIHDRILEIGSGISPLFSRALEAVDPVSFPDREDNGVGHFLSRAVVGQQLSTKAARKIWSRVEKVAFSSGSDIPQFFDKRCHAALRTCGVSRNKIKALQSLYEAERAGLLRSERLRELDHSARSRQLVSIWGIGQWTCDMLSIFYFRCPDVWPEGDATVQKVFARLIDPCKPSEAVSYFVPYRSYLALAMWRIADASPQGR